MGMCVQKTVCVERILRWGKKNCSWTNGWNLFLFKCAIIHVQKTNLIRTGVQELSLSITSHLLCRKGLDVVNSMCIFWHSYTTLCRFQLLCSWLHYVAKHGVFTSVFALFLLPQRASGKGNSQVYQTSTRTNKLERIIPGRCDRALTFIMVNRDSILQTCFSIRQPVTSAAYANSGKVIFVATSQTRRGENGTARRSQGRLAYWNLK